MPTPAPTLEAGPAGVTEKMPWFALAVLAFTGFILIAAETMPAGLLPVIAGALDTSEGTIGQFISTWALGTVVATIPALGLTRGLNRKPLILTVIACLSAANTVTAISSNIPLSLLSRFIAGACTGIIWGMLAAYGRRISPVRHGGLSLAIVSTGTPLGFALGTPLGTWLGTTFNWRWSFGALSILAAAAFTLITVFAPDAPGQPAATRLPLRRVFTLPGIAIILSVIFVWMLAHNTIYTYIAPYLHETGTGLRPDLVLLVYGIASIAGLGLTAAFVDRHPHTLLFLSITFFVVAALVLLLAHTSSLTVLTAAALWGITFGGGPTQLQAALTLAGRENSDTANSFLPVAFNLAIFGAGITGALMLNHFSALVLPTLMAALGGAALLIVIYGRRTAFNGAP